MVDEEGVCVGLERKQRQFHYYEDEEESEWIKNQGAVRIYLESAVMILVLFLIRIFKFMI